MNSFETVNTAVLAGELLFRNGAETYRVEDTVSRMLKACGMEQVSTFAVPTGIFVSTEDSEHRIITKLVRMTTRGVDLNNIAIINELSRALADGRATIEETALRLRELDAPARSSRSPKALLRIPLIAVTTAVTLLALYEDAYADIPACLITGLALGAVIYFLGLKRVSAYIVDFLGGAALALVAILLVRAGLGINTDRVIVSGIMPMVPGLAITNAVRDLIAGDLLSGLARAADAFLTAIFIAAGVGIVLGVSLLL